MKIILFKIQKSQQKKKYIIKVQDNDDDDDEIAKNKNKDSGIEKYLKCKHYNNQFKYYCLKEGIDLCEECLKEHKCENIKNFEDEKADLDNDIIPFIAKSLKGPNSNNFSQNLSFDSEISQIDYLEILISCLIHHYYDSPNYNIIVNIKNFYSKLNNTDIQDTKNFEQKK